MVAPPAVPGPGPKRLRYRPVRPTLEALGRGLFVLFVFFACFAFIEPSPYDFVAIPTLILWLLLGLKVHRAVLPFVVLLILYNLGLLLALVPYFHEANPVLWTVQSLYLAVTGIFFALFFSDDATRRVELALKAYVASCLLSATLGVVGYLDLLGREDLFSMYGRASGTFKDPNVFGSFLALGALYLMHNLLTGATRRPVLSLLALLVLAAGLFLSFSRGSWLGTAVATLFLVTATFVTTGSQRVRRRIVLIGAVTGICGAVLIAGLLSVPEIAERFTARAALTQEYDVGVGGRFGNQVRGLGLVVAAPEGLGPLRWRLTFGLEPHNSYIGGFANGGWLGGFAFLGLVLMTTAVGFRLCFRPSPFQRQAQIVFAALFMFFLQAVQIDVDHWRHVYMMLGMVWGLEAARLAWLKSARAASLQPPPTPSTTLPVPPQVLQGAASRRPVPRQSGQTFSPVPGVPGVA